MNPMSDTLQIERLLETIASAFLERLEKLGVMGNGVFLVIALALTVVSRSVIVRLYWPSWASHPLGLLWVYGGMLMFGFATGTFVTMMYICWAYPQQGEPKAIE